MKKTILFLSGLLCFCLNLRAQFVSPGYSETIYPTAAMDAVLRPQHTSCYEMNGITVFGPTNNLYLHTWNSSGSGGSSTLNGIGWRRTAPGGAFPLYDFGYQIIPGVIYDLEAAFVQLGSTIFIVATYYKVGAGHRYEIYKWNPIGITYYAGGALSSSTTYGRISLDAHRLYGIAITWEVAGRVYVKALNTASGSWAIGNDIEIGGVSTGAIPDVAFSHASDLDVRIAYVNQTTGDVHVVHRDFTTLLSAGAGPLGFTTDDINPASFPSGIAGFPLKADDLQLDCPDHYTSDNWSYIYTDDEINVNARIRGTSLFTVNLTAGTDTWLSDNRNLAIAYAPGGTRIHYGWFTGYTGFTPVPGYVATERNDDGTYVTPPLPGWLKIVANTTTYSSIPVMSFSKQNDNSLNLFAVYAMHGTGGSGYEIRFKNNVPWSATSFRPAPEDERPLELQEGNISITTAPNPFTDALTVIAPYNNGQAYDVNLSDIHGRIIFRGNGAIDNINHQLKAFGVSKIVAGTYFLKVSSSTMNKALKVIKKD